MSNPTIPTNITTFVRPVRTLDYWFLSRPGTSEMLCVKRGVQGFYAPLCKKYDRVMEAQGYIQGMNWLNCRNAGVEVSEVGDSMLLCALFGWDFKGDFTQEDFDARMLQSLKDLGADKLLRHLGYGWKDICAR